MKLKTLALALPLSFFALPALADNVTLPGGVTITMEQLCAADKRHTIRDINDGANVAKRVVARKDGQVKVRGVLLAGVTCPAIKTAGLKYGGGGGGFASGESLETSQTRSGETNPGETTGGPTGETDTGADTGIGAISG